MEQAAACDGAGDKNRDAETQEAWLGVCERLSELVSEDAFERWFRASRFLGVDGRKAHIGVPNQIHQVWIETNYLG